MVHPGVVEVGALTDSGVANGTTGSNLREAAVKIILDPNFVAEGEFGVIVRTDLFLDILVEVLGENIPTIARNLTTDTTSKGSRPDVALSISHFPAFVFIEEKDDDSDLWTAIQQLHRIFEPIPHYGLLPFVVFIAITPNIIMFTARPLGNVAILPCPLTLNLTLRENRLYAIRAFINMGRWCNGVLQNLQNLQVAEITHPFNKVVDRRSGAKKIILTASGVQATYLNVSPYLADFYRLTSGCRYLEKTTARPIAVRNGGTLFKLVPIGSPGEPKDVNELREAVRCVLTALAGIHALGWTHNDVRWPNVVRVPRVGWFLIDCEYAWPIDRSDVPSEGFVRRDPVAKSNSFAYADLFLVGHLLNDYSGMLPPGSPGAQLCDQLLDDKLRPQMTAAQALASSWFS